LLLHYHTIYYINGLFNLILRALDKLARYVSLYVSLSLLLIIYRFWHHSICRYNTIATTTSSEHRHQQLKHSFPLIHHHYEYLYPLRVKSYVWSEQWCRLWETSFPKFSLQKIKTNSIVKLTWWILEDQQREGELRNVASLPNWLLHYIMSDYYKNVWTTASPKEISTILLEKCQSVRLITKSACIKV